MPETEVAPRSWGFGVRFQRPDLRLGEHRRALLESAALLASFLVWMAAEATGYKVAAFTAMFPAWAFYFALRVWRDPDLVRDWGFRTDNLALGAVVYGLATLVTVGALWLYALLRGEYGVSASLLLVLVLYPPWALAQQFLLQNIIVGNARALGMPEALLPLLAAAVFAGAHLPDGPLAFLTALGGFILTGIYRRIPNLWLCAIAHALIGTAAFTLVLARDPLAEFPGLTQVASLLPEPEWLR